ncbi:hypothetical protein SUNI508_02055 [Seiridium unicorne]|uniref:Short-chain dehydrogenase/reductase family protein n=1 Tax=Seiridium unicorne TaxID=138068 RepID=A0ABR2UKP3_9PEZI
MSAQLQHEAAFEAGIVGFLYRQWLIRRKTVPAGTSLEDQTAIVTGSNGGLGLESCRQLLQLGLSTLIMGVRSISKGEDAAKGLRESFPSAAIKVWHVDMESYDSIRNFAAQCESLERIDITILNAGVQSYAYKRVEATGHELCLQVNYFSTALLSILLLPVLRARRHSASRPPVLDIVTSDTAYWTTIDPERPVVAQLDREEDFNEHKQYMGTKLLEMFFVVKLAEQVSAADIIINMANPGFTTGTAIGGGSPNTANAMFKLFKWMTARSIEVGASTYVDATVVQGESSHGSFCSDWSLRPYNALLYTEDGQKIKERLWEETMEELNFAGASKIVQSMQN